MKIKIETSDDSSSSNSTKRKRKRRTSVTDIVKKQNKRDFKTDDFLMTKMKKIKGSFIEACRSDDVDRVGSMLSFGAEVNWRDRKGLSGLHLAADNGYTELLEVLLAQPRVSVNLRNKNQNTALMFACSSGHEDTVRLLCQAGISTRCRGLFRGGESYLLCHKEPARPSKAPYLGLWNAKRPNGSYLLAPRWFFMAYGGL